jgi:serine/threonine protein kinase
MESTSLTPKDRQHLEEVLDQFDRALKECRTGRLPEVDEYLGAYSGGQRDYLRKEMELVRAEVVRGEYVKLRRLGGGGMGEVFLARHVALGREFALKEIKLECLRHDDRAEFEKRFRREIEACGRLEHHPNLVNVTNTGTSETGAPYLVMDYIEGRDLKQLVERNGPLDVPLAARIIHDAAQGLAHAHERGLVHRDIKPSNIMVSKHGVVVVLDLGLARLVESDRQVSVVSMPGLVGSFDYMSPEQCREEQEVDLRADVYALGCTLYYLLAGRPPFAEAKSIFQKLNAQQTEPLPAIDRVDRHSELWRLLLHMTAKDPAQRPQSLVEVVAALRPLMRDADLERLAQSVSSVSSLAGRLRETQSEQGSGSTAIYQPRDRSLGASGDQRATSGSASGSRIGSATRALGRQLTRRRFMAIGAIGAVAAASAGAVAWSKRRHWGAEFLETLPGLNGRWWFDEIPWLLPDVRMFLADSLDVWHGELWSLHAQAHSGDIPAFYAALRDRVDEASGDFPTATANRYEVLRTIDPERLLPERWKETPAAIAKELPDEPNRGAVDWHIHANILHYQESFDEAARAYEQAVKQYVSDGRTPMAALALADWGQLHLKERKTGLAKDKFSRSRKLMADESHAPAELLRLFAVDSLCNEADAHRGFDNWDPAWHCLDEARTLVEQLADEHPLRAVYLERSAWYHFDVWRVDRADRDFREARALREASHKAGNHRAINFVYWNRQGQAMVDYYQGRVGEARDELEKLTGDNETMAEASADYTVRQQAELRRRQPNLLERLADAELVEPGAQNDAVACMEDAIDEAAAQGFKDNARLPVLIRLDFKTAVIAALTGDLGGAMAHFAAATEAAERLRKESAAPGGRQVRTTRSSRFEVSRSLAAACVDWLSPDAKMQQEAIKRIANQFKRSLAELTRDELLLLMFVGDRFLQSGDSATYRDARRDIAAGVSRLADVRPLGKEVPPAGDRAYTPPPLLVRYREMADRYLKDTAEPAAG